MKESIQKAVKNLLQQANLRNLNTRFVYANILRELNRNTEEIVTLEELRKIKYVGEKTFKAIISAVNKIDEIEILEKNEEVRNRKNKEETEKDNMTSIIDVSENKNLTHKKYKYIPDDVLDILSSSTDCEILLDKGEEGDIEKHLSDRFSSSCVIVRDHELNKEKKVKEDRGDSESNKNDNKSNKKPRKTANSRVYIPAYRSAPYAVLKALSELKSAHKYLIALKASPFTDAEFNNAVKFSAFSAFKSLEKKGLIYSEIKSKYILTEQGEELCKALFNRSVEIPIEFPIEDKGIKLVIDSREKRSHRDRGFFQSYFTEKGVENSTRYLGVGDFLWINEERILNYIVERKGGSDFGSSISDGRYREQKRRLRISNVHVFYIIENLKYNDNNRNLCKYCLTETKMDGFTVLETEDIKESAAVITAIDAKIRSGDFSEVMSYGSFIEEGTKQIDVHTILLTALLGIRGLGKERAIRLAEVFHTMTGFHAAVSRRGFLMELSKMEICGRALGMSMAKKIIQMLE
ncbi:crossover junction endonuclease MUS81 [Pancytospora epiphaga]|nr:crossover junction endonuclease MUS81 [Pancytospora epiphaga]